MINPSRVHRARGVIQTKHAFRDLGGTILVNGRELTTYQDLSQFEIGQVVNIQANFSIMSDRYIIKTVRKIKGVS